MSSWGNLNQPVTVTPSTTFESSNGAPIGAGVYAKWGADNANVAVTANNAEFGNTSPHSKAELDLSFYQNNTPSAYINGMAVGIFGISANQSLASNTYLGAHAGWTIVRIGTGGRAGRIQAETMIAMGTLADPVTSPLVDAASDVLQAPDASPLILGF